MYVYICMFVHIHNRRMNNNKHLPTRWYILPFKERKRDTTLQKDNQQNDNKRNTVESILKMDTP